MCKVMLGRLSLAAAVAAQLGACAAESSGPRRLHEPVPVLPPQAAPSQAPSTPLEPPPAQVPVRPPDPEAMDADLGAAGGMAPSAVGAAGMGAAGAASLPSMGDTAGTSSPPAPVEVPVSVDCPDGLASDLDPVLVGDTVPGNLDLGLAGSPETTRNPCGTPEEQACFRIANEHRVAAGLAPFKWDGDLADLARSHAADRTQLGYYFIGAHGSSTQGFLHLYQERAEFLGLKPSKFSSVVENAHSGPRTGAEVMAGFMASSSHRDVIMGVGSWSRLTHAACGQDGVEWNMEFGQVGW